jgi:S1-C subfamily serine protease
MSLFQPLEDTMNDSDWYYEKNDQRNGPVSQLDLQSLFDSKELEPSTLVWNQNLKGWVPAIQIIEFSFSAELLPPPLPKRKKRFYISVLAISVPVLIASVILVISNSFFPNLFKPDRTGDLTSAVRTYTIQEIAQNTKSVLLLNVYDDSMNLISTGSGFIISDDGKLVTNYHVVADAVFMEAVTDDDFKYEITGILSYDKEKDVAILQLSEAANLPVLSLGNSDDLVVGDEVVAIGSPVGLKNTVSGGNVSAFRNDDSGKSIQITAPISPGSSGGALFSLHNKIVGITFASVVDGQNLNFAIPINDIKPLIAVTKLRTFLQVRAELEPKTGNTISNIFNDGLVVEDENAVYYSYRMPRAPQGIFKLKKGELVPSQICDDDYVSSLNLVNGVLYYPLSGYLMSINTDGSSSRRIAIAGMNYFATIIGDNVFYMTSHSNSDLYVTTIDGKNTTKLNKVKIQQYCVKGNWIYMLESSREPIIFDMYGGIRLFRVNMDDGNEETLLSSEDLSPKSSLSKFDVSGDWLYFSVFLGKQGDGLFRIRTTGDIGSLTLLDSNIDPLVSTFNLSDDGWLYCVSNTDDRGLCRIAQDGSIKEVLGDASADFINLTSEWVYCWESMSTRNMVNSSFRGPLSFYRIKKDGTEKELLFTIK